MNALGRWFAGLAVTAVGTAVAFIWLDRPLATWAHYELAKPHQALFVKLTHIPDPLIPAAAIAFVVLGLIVLAGRSLSRPQTALFAAAVSLVMAEAIKNQLKFVFGRTWPETWVQNNPSFIRDGAYGFNWLHGGPGYQSFPSGHTAVTCALMAALWIWYPRWRPLYALVAVAVGAGLVGANYHFLSDVIAGAYVGISAAWMATALCERCASPRLPGPRG